MNGTHRNLTLKSVVVRMIQVFSTNPFAWYVKGTKNQSIN